MSDGRGTADGRGRFVGAFGVSILAVTAAYASAFGSGGVPRWAPWAMAVGTTGSLVSAMALGASRGGRVGPLAYPLLFVLVTLVAGFGSALSLPAPAAVDGALWLGLPPPAAVVLYGVGLLPLLVVPLAYAVTFDRMTLDETDWERIRAAAAREGSAWPRDDEAEAGTPRPSDTSREGTGP